MFQFTKTRLVFIGLISLLLFFSQFASAEYSQIKAGSWMTFTIPAPSLSNNLLHTPDTQRIGVYIPPSYTNTNNRYPVVYFLTGYTVSFSEYFYIAGMMNSKIKDKKIKEMIFVVPNGVNSLGGGFYHNSPVTGNWEDFITKDVVEFIDSNFRTIAGAESRGISGTSMGGYGSIEIALKHPDLFSALFSLSPGIFERDFIGLREAFSQWRSGIPYNTPNFIPAYGAAFSPDIQLKAPFAEIPQFDNTPEDNRIVSNWVNGFGNFSVKLDIYQKKSEKLKNIRIEWGNSDEYSWIPKGCVYFTELLSNRNISYSAKIFNGGHINRVSDRISESLLPYFSENLSN